MERRGMAQYFAKDTKGKTELKTGL